MKRLNRGHVAFLCCDIQEIFRPTIHQFEHVVRTASILTQTAKLFHAPLIVSEQYPEKLGRTVSEIDLTQVTNQFVYAKSDFSMLTESFPAPILKEFNSFVLFGIEAHVCIQQTALDLLAKGKSVFLVTDAISSSRPLDRSTALHRLSSAGAILITAESVLFELTGSKEALEFKQVSSLAKSLGGFYRDNMQKCLSSL